MADKIEVNVDQLIRLVRARPCIWDGSKKNGFERQQKWQEIYSIMHPGYENLQEGTRIEKGSAIKNKWNECRSKLQRKCAALRRQKMEGTFRREIAILELKNLKLNFLWKIYRVNEILSSRIPKNPPSPLGTQSFVRKGQFYDPSQVRQRKKGSKQTHPPTARTFSEKHNIDQVYEAQLPSNLQRNNPQGSKVDPDAETVLNFRINPSKRQNGDPRKSVLEMDSTSMKDLLQSQSLNIDTGRYAGMVSQTKQSKEAGKVQIIQTPMMLNQVKSNFIEPQSTKSVLQEDVLAPQARIDQSEDRVLINIQSEEGPLKCSSNKSKSTMVKQGITLAIKRQSNKRPAGKDFDELPSKMCRSVRDDPVEPRASEAFIKDSFKQSQPTGSCQVKQGVKTNWSQEKLPIQLEPLRDQFIERTVIETQQTDGTAGNKCNKSISKQINQEKPNTVVSLQMGGPPKNNFNDLQARRDPHIEHKVIGPKSADGSPKSIYNNPHPFNMYQEKPNFIAAQSKNEPGDRTHNKNPQPKKIKQVKPNVIVPQLKGRPLEVIKHNFIESQSMGSSIALDYSDKSSQNMTDEDLVNNISEYLEEPEVKEVKEHHDSSNGNVKFRSCPSETSTRVKETENVSVCNSNELHPTKQPLNEYANDFLNGIQSFLRPHVENLNEAQILKFKTGIMQLLQSIRFPETPKYS